MQKSRIRRSGVSTQSAVIGMIVSVGSLASKASAEALLNATFGDYADGALVGQKSWTQLGTAAGRPLTITGGVLRIGALPISAFDAPYQSASLALSQIIRPLSVNRELLFSIDITVNEIPAGSNDNVRGFSLITESAGFSNAKVSIRQGTEPNTFQFGARTTGQANASTAYGANLSLGSGYVLYARHTFVPGPGNDFFELYVNPDLTADGQIEGSARYALAFGGTDPDGFRAFSVNQFTNSINSQPGMDVRQIQVYSIAPVYVPEPTVLFGLTSGIAIFGRRRS